MSDLLQASAHNTIQRYVKAGLLHLHRFVNNSVAEMLASRERQVRLALGKSAVFGLIVAGSLPSAVTRTEGSVVRDYLSGGPAQVAVPTPRGAPGNAVSPGACRLTPTGQTNAREHPSR